MKKLFIRFFQVLCLVLFVGSGQLNAHSRARVSHTAFTKQFKGVEQVQLFTIKDEGFLKAHLFAPVPEKTFKLLVNVFESELKQTNYKKIQESNHSLTFLFPTQLPKYLFHNSKSSLAFCKQLSFIPVNKRCIIFQVFRI